MSVGERTRVPAPAEGACPVCRHPIVDEAKCAVCGWALGGGWVLGPVTPDTEAAFNARMEGAQRRFDLAAAVLAAGFPDAGQDELLSRLESHVRGGPPEPAERDEVLATVSAPDPSPGAEGPATARDFARRAAERDGVRTVLVVEIDADGLAASTFETDAPDAVRQRAGGDAWTWTAMLPELAEDAGERRLQLAGGIGLHPVVPAQLNADLERALPVIPTDGVHVVLVCRVPGWPVPERALDLLAARLPGAERAWRRSEKADDEEATGPAVIRTPAAIAAFAATGAEHAVTGGGEGTVTVWAPPSPEPTARRRLHDGRVTALAVVLDSAGDVSVVTGGKDGTVRRWSPGIDHERLLAQHDGWVNAVRIAGNHVFSLADDGCVRRTSTVPGQSPLSPTVPVDVGWSASTALAVARDGRRLVVAGDDGRVALLDAATGQEVRAAPVEVPVTALELDPDDRCLAIGCRDGRILIHRFPDLVPARELRAGDAPVRALALTGDGFVLAGDEAGAVRLWSPDGEGEPAGEHGDAVRGISLDASGRAISGAADGVIGIWELGLT